MKKIFLAAFIVAMAVSCKDSVDEPSINPVTQEILANGLSLPASGADTTIVFPFSGESKVTVSYINEDSQWCSANETSEGNVLKVNLKCQPSSTLLIQRQAKVIVSSANRSYELIIRQAPLPQAYTDQTVYSLSNDGGTYTIPIHANTAFMVYKTIYLIGSGENTRDVDTSWLGVSNEHEKVTADVDNIYNLELNAGLNTGLGRKAFLSVVGDSIKEKIIEIRQEPRKFNESETIDVSDPFSFSLDVLLGNDTTNLRRIKNLKVIGRVYSDRLQYLANLNKVALESLDMSEAYFGKYTKEVDREIEKRQFFKTSLHSILLPSDLASIGEEAFAACTNIETITIPSTVTWIGARAFANSSSIKNIVIPKDSQLASLGAEAFNTGSVIESLFIPSSVSDLSPDALVGMQAKELHVTWTTPPTMNGTAYSDCTLYVPKGCADKYRAADYWKDYNNIVEE